MAGIRNNDGLRSPAGGLNGLRFDPSEVSCDGYDFVGDRLILFDYLFYFLFWLSFPHAT